MKKRIDLLIHEKWPDISRSQAKLLVEEGKITVGGIPVKKSSQEFSGSENIQIETETLYVGRAGQKLEHAISQFQINVQGMVAADFGASTGGFTQVLLAHGAIKVYAIDVGHDQLATSLKNDSRVINMEGINVRELESLPSAIDLAVVDLSFISLRLVMGNIVRLLGRGKDLVVLIKPQFEVGREHVKKGIVKDQLRVDEVLHELKVLFMELGLTWKELIQSPIKGKEGNTEYLVHLKS